MYLVFRKLFVGHLVGVEAFVACKQHGINTRIVGCHIASPQHMQPFVQFNGAYLFPVITLPAVYALQGKLHGV